MSSILLLGSPGVVFAKLPGEAVIAGMLSEDAGEFSGSGELSASGVPVGVGGSGKGVEPGTSGASEAWLLGEPTGAAGEGVGRDVTGGMPSDSGGDEAEEGEVAGVPVFGLLGEADGAGKAPLAVGGDDTRLPDDGVIGLGLLLSDPGDAVGIAVGVPLVPVDADGEGFVVGLATGDAVGVALVPVDAVGDADVPVGVLPAVEGPGLAAGLRCPAGNPGLAGPAEGVWRGKEGYAPGGVLPEGTGGEAFGGEPEVE